MGIFSQLFKKKKAEVYELGREELKHFVKKLADERFKNIRAELWEHISGIAEECTSLKNTIDSLETAELGNKKIPAKELHIMEGNRSGFIQRHRFFLEKVALPEELNYDSVQGFIASVQSQLKILAETSDKSYRVLTEKHHHVLARL